VRGVAHDRHKTSFHELQGRNEIVVCKRFTRGFPFKFPKIVNGVLGTQVQDRHRYPGGKRPAISHRARREVQGARCSWSWTVSREAPCRGSSREDSTSCSRWASQGIPSAPDVPLIMDLSPKGAEGRTAHPQAHLRASGHGVALSRTAGVPKASVWRPSARPSRAMTGPGYTGGGCFFFLKDPRLKFRTVAGGDIQKLVEEVLREPPAALPKSRRIPQR